MHTPIVDRLQAVLARRPCGLLTDIDGTISPIAPTPEAATVDQRCRQALRRLAHHLDVVGAVSGRAAADAAAMVGLDALIYIGNHGMERWERGSAAPLPEAQTYAGHIARALEEAQRLLDLPGLRFENKGITASIHYRLAPNPAQAQEQVRAALEPVIDRLGLVMTPGRMVWEIRPPLAWGKGAAVERIIAERGLRGVFFLGDDTTDVHAFRSLAELRRTGRIDALIIGVMAAETPPEVRAESDIQVEGVEGVAQLLETLASLLEDRQP